MTYLIFYLKCILSPSFIALTWHFSNLLEWCPSCTKCVVIWFMLNSFPCKMLLYKDVKVIQNMESNVVNHWEATGNCFLAVTHVTLILGTHFSPTCFPLLLFFSLPFLLSLLFFFSLLTSFFFVSSSQLLERFGQDIPGHLHSDSAGCPEDQSQDNRHCGDALHIQGPALQVRISSL